MALINSQRLRRFMCAPYVKISEKCYPKLGKYADKLDNNYKNWFL